MANLNRLGLGTMGMCRANRDRSIDTVRHALDAGVTLLNTSEFYRNSESEIVLGQALEGVPRDSYFLSVKFGMLPQPSGGHYGIDVGPWHVKARLTYSMARLGLDYVDLYQPARLDEEIPVEEVVGAIGELVDAGYVRHVGLSMVDADTLRRASAERPIHTVEVEYSLANRGIEHGLIQAAQECGTQVLAFGALAHGLITEGILDDSTTPHIPAPVFRPENLAHNRELVRGLKDIADEKGTTVSNLALAWTLAKYDNVSALVGTTSVAHLDDAIAAMALELTDADLVRVEQAFPEGAVHGLGMRNMRFVGGKVLMV